MTKAREMGTIRYAAMYMGMAEAAVLPDDCEEDEITPVLCVTRDDNGAEKVGLFEDPNDAANLAVQLADKFPGGVYEIVEIRVIGVTVARDYAHVVLPNDPDSVTFNLG